MGQFSQFDDELTDDELRHLEERRLQAIARSATPLPPQEGGAHLPTNKEGQNSSSQGEKPAGNA